MSSSNTRVSVNYLSNTEKLSFIIDRLPDFCYTFLLNSSLELSVTTRLAYARDLEHFFRYLLSVHYFDCDSIKDIHLSDLRKIDSICISSYLTCYFNTGCQKKTVARKKSTLASFFHYMLVNKRIESNPMDAVVKVSIPKNDDLIYLTVEEQNILLSAISTGDSLTKSQKPYHARYVLRDLSIFLLFLDTGMRVSELNGINIKDVGMDDCSVVVLRKGAKLQTLYFSDDTRDTIKKYLSSRKNKGNISPSDPLFVTEKGNRLSVRAIQVLVTKYVSAALPQKRHISPHKMRSSFAMTYYEETKDILALQRKLAHSSIQTTTIYAKASDKKMQETRDVTNVARNRIKYD